jgi:hypothetical protein
LRNGTRRNWRFFQGIHCIREIMLCDAFSSRQPASTRGSSPGACFA